MDVRFARAIHSDDSVIWASIVAYLSVPDSIAPELVLIDGSQRIVTKTIPINTSQLFSLKLSYHNDNGEEVEFNFHHYHRFVLKVDGVVLADTNTNRALITVDSDDPARLIFDLAGENWLVLGVFTAELLVFDTAHPNGQSVLLGYGQTRMQLNIVNG